MTLTRRGIFGKPKHMSHRQRIADGTWSDSLTAPPKMNPRLYDLVQTAKQDLEGIVPTDGNMSPTHRIVAQCYPIPLSTPTAIDSVTSHTHIALTSTAETQKRRQRLHLPMHTNSCDDTIPQHLHCSSTDSKDGTSIATNHGITPPLEAAPPSANIIKIQLPTSGSPQTSPPGPRPPFAESRQRIAFSLRNPRHTPNASETYLLVHNSIRMSTTYVSDHHIQPSTLPSHMNNLAYDQAVVARATMLNEKHQPMAQDRAWSRLELRNQQTGGDRARPHNQDPTLRMHYTPLKLNCTAGGLETGPTRRSGRNCTASSRIQAVADALRASQAHIDRVKSEQAANGMYGDSEKSDIAITTNTHGKERHHAERHAKTRWRPHGEGARTVLPEAAYNAAIEVATILKVTTAVAQEATTTLPKTQIVETRILSTPADPRKTEGVLHTKAQVHTAEHTPTEYRASAQLPRSTINNLETTNEQIETEAQRVNKSRLTSSVRDLPPTLPKPWTSTARSGIVQPGMVSGLHRLEPDQPPKGRRRRPRTARHPVHEDLHLPSAEWETVVRYYMSQLRQDQAHVHEIYHKGAANHIKADIQLGRDQTIKLAGPSTKVTWSKGGLGAH